MYRSSQLNVCKEIDNSPFPQSNWGVLAIRGFVCVSQTRQQPLLPAARIQATASL